MFTSLDVAPITAPENELPKRTPASPDRRPTILSNGVPNGRNLFGGWGPRLG